MILFLFYFLILLFQVWMDDMDLCMDLSRYHSEFGGGGFSFLFPFVTGFLHHINE